VEELAVTSLRIMGSFPADPQGEGARQHPVEWVHIP